jgi:lipopolysaccharide export system protein LptC
MGNVTLQIAGRPTLPNTSVATDFATVNIPSELVKTEHKATVTRNSLIGFSDGFIYDAQNGLLNLLSDVTLTYDD